jgi:hypothetical protein
LRFKATHAAVGQVEVRLASDPCRLEPGHDRAVGGIERAPERPDAETAPLWRSHLRDNECVAEVFQQLARESHGAYHRYAGAAGQRAELLRAVTAYAVGGTQALADVHTDAARKLLGQVKGWSQNEN